MIDIECARESKNPKNVYDLLKYKSELHREHPDYFDPDGLLIFVGPQGSGKTLSAVNYVSNLLKKYPKSKLVTNINLKDYPIISFQEFRKNNITLIENLKESKVLNVKINKILEDKYLEENRIFEFKNNDSFQYFNNGEYGVIFLVDEIQLYLNSLESKNINMDTMTQISQQRKQRKHIVCTSQVFGRIAKPLREQFTSVILCKSYLKTFQLNKLVDRDSLDSDSSADTVISGKVRSKFFWIHNPNMYKRYDTYYIIEKGKFIGEEKKKGDIYDNGIKLPNNC